MTNSIVITSSLLSVRQEWVRSPHGTFRKCSIFCLKSWNFGSLARVLINLVFHPLHIPSKFQRILIETFLSHVRYPARWHLAEPVRVSTCMISTGPPSYLLQRSSLPLCDGHVWPLYIFSVGTKCPAPTLVIRSTAVAIVPLPVVVAPVGHPSGRPAGGVDGRGPRGVPGVVLFPACVNSFQRIQIQ